MQFPPLQLFLRFACRYEGDQDGGEGNTGVVVGFLDGDGKEHGEYGGIGTLKKDCANVKWDGQGDQAYHYSMQKTCLSHRDKDHKFELSLSQVKCADGNLGDNEVIGGGSGSVSSDGRSSSDGSGGSRDDRGGGNRVEAGGGTEKEQMELAEVLKWIGRLNYMMGNHSLCLDSMGRALLIMKRFLGEDHPEVGKLLSNMGFASWEGGGDPRDAVYLLKRALAIKEGSPGVGAEHPSTARTLANLSLVFVEMGDYDEALETGTRALAVMQRALGQGNQETASQLRNLGRVRSYLGEHAQAAADLAAALATHVDVVGEVHIETAETRRVYGGVLRRAGDAVGAVQQCEAALAVVEQVFPATHWQVGLAFMEAGMAYRARRGGAAGIAGEVRKVGEAVEAAEAGEIGEVVTMGSNGGGEEEVTVGVSLLEKARAILAPQPNKFRREIAELERELSGSGGGE